MIKREEQSDPNSCWNRAADDEMVFVLLGRDVAAPNAIRVWIDKRISTGKNQPGDKQVAEAINCVRHMENIDQVAHRIKLWAEYKIKTLSRPWEPGDGESRVVDDDALTAALLEAYEKGRSDAAGLKTVIGCPQVISPGPDRKNEHCALPEGHPGPHKSLYGEW